MVFGEPCGGQGGELASENEVLSRPPPPFGDPLGTILGGFWRHFWSFGFHFEVTWGGFGEQVWGYFPVPCLVLCSLAAGILTPSVLLRSLCPLVLSCVPWWPLVSLSPVRAQRASEASEASGAIELCFLAFTCGSLRFLVFPCVRLRSRVFPFPV